MCGRYQLAGDWDEFTRQFELEETPNLKSRYNIAPSYGPGFEVPVLTEPGRLTMARFWYIPRHWAEPLKALPTAFNARSETVLRKRHFKGARPCLIPTSGWREFPGPAGKKRAVVFDQRAADAPGQQSAFFAFAGIWTEYEAKEGGAPLATCAILTGEPNPVVAAYHDRMPLLVAPHFYRGWLSGPLSEEALAACVSYSHEVRLRAYEASTFGNPTSREGPECILEKQPERSLFPGLD